MYKYELQVITYKLIDIENTAKYKMTWIAQKTHTGASYFYGCAGSPKCHEAEQHEIVSMQKITKVSKTKNITDHILYTSRIENNQDILRSLYFLRLTIYSTLIILDHWKDPRGFSESMILSRCLCSRTLLVFLSSK